MENQSKGKSLAEYRRLAAERNAVLDKENEDRAARYEQEQADRQENGEEGLHSAGLTEIPGAREVKDKIKAGISGLEFPGAKYVAEGVDVLTPDSVDSLPGMIQHAGQKVAKAGLAHMAGATAMPIAAKLASRAGQAAEAASDLGRLGMEEDAAAGIWDKSKVASPANTPQRLSPRQAALTPEQQERIRKVVAAKAADKAAKAANP